MRIHGAIFDMDGTLVDSLGFWDMLWRLLGERYKGSAEFRPDPETERAIRTLPLLEAMCLLHEKSGIGESGTQLHRLTTDTCAQFYKDTVMPKEGVLAFLDHLQDCGVKMCVASATAPDLLSILFDRWGLERYFPRLFSCSEIGKGKEFPDVFHAAHRYLGTDIESTWVFEDSFVALQTARHAGFQTVGVYDVHNFNLDRMPEVSTKYIAKGESLLRLIPEMKL